jgi:hypothetical protein
MTNEEIPQKDGVTRLGILIIMLLLHNKNRNSSRINTWGGWYWVRFINIIHRRHTNVKKQQGKKEE